MGILRERKKTDNFFVKKPVVRGNVVKNTQMRSRGLLHKPVLVVCFLLAGVWQYAHHKHNNVAILLVFPCFVSRGLSEVNAYFLGELLAFYLGAYFKTARRGGGKVENSLARFIGGGLAGFDV